MCNVIQGTVPSLHKNENPASISLAHFMTVAL